MYSFDDYYYFYLVVKHGGFSAASEASGITKSKLSRRIIELEERFDVSLIQRSTRHFKVTTLGQQFFEECSKIINQTLAAKNVLTNQRIEPQGLIKISCPPVMMEHQIRQLLVKFLKQYPKVQLEIQLTSQRIDVLEDDIDLAIRTNFSENEDANIIVREIIRTKHCLVASPQLLQGDYLQHITELNEYPSIVLGTKKNPSWSLKNLKSNEEIEIILNPKIQTNELMAVHFCVLDGLGIADLPYLVVKDDIESGKLIHLLPEWCSNVGMVELVYASRKGQQIVLELLIDYLVENIRSYTKQDKGYIY